jgi:hypothetical protein
MDSRRRARDAEAMLLQLLLFLAALVIFDIAALRWGYDSRTAAALGDPYRPDLW